MFWILKIAFLFVIALTGLAVYDSFCKRAEFRHRCRNKELRDSLEETSFGRLRTAISSCEELLSVPPASLLDFRGPRLSPSLVEPGPSCISVTLKLAFAAWQCRDAYVASLESRLQDSLELRDRFNANIDSALQDAKQVRLNQAAAVKVRALLRS